MASRPTGNAPSQFSPFPDGDPNNDDPTMAQVPAASGFLIRDVAAMPFDLLQEEVRCARLFNLELAEAPEQALLQLTQAVMTFTRSRTCRLLWRNQATGRYVCLSDRMTPGVTPRELLDITTTSLQALTDTAAISHAYLFENDQLVGLVVIGVETDQSAAQALWHELALELMAPYLAVKLSALMARRQDRLLVNVRDKALRVAQQLMTAVDVDSVLTTALSACGESLGFCVAHYIGLDVGLAADAGPEQAPELLMEWTQGQVRSYLHAGLKSKRRQLTGLHGVLTMLANGTPMHLGGAQLAERPIQDMLGLRRLRQMRLSGALLLPVAEASPMITPPSLGLQGILALYRADGKPMGPEMVRVASEIAMMTGLALSRAHVLEKALEMATTDELTSLANRRGFYDRFESELERARRQQSPLCAAMIDVDYFKRLNDAYGHLNGDIALRTLAGKIRASLRKSDLVCRFGGEEFAVLLPDTGFAAAVDLMERLRRAIEDTVICGVDNEVIHATVSIGVAQACTAQGLTRPARELISEALAAADEQLYGAKNAGRNRVYPQDMPQDVSHTNSIG